MNNSQLAKALSVIVITVGTVVMFGWFLDIDILKSILPHWVTMKFTTALCFFMSGIVLHFIVMANQGKLEAAQTFLPLPCLVITLIMASLLASVFLGIRTGIEDLFVKEKVDAIHTTTPGRPSIGTMIAFLGVVVAGFLTIMKIKTLKSILKILGFIVAVSGALAIMGYFMNMEHLYYAWAGVSTAMAFHTAILFVFLGVGLILTSKG